MSGSSIAICNCDGAAMLANCKSIELAEHCKSIFNSGLNMELRHMLFLPPGLARLLLLSLVMRIAIPTSEDRVSPVFDAASRLLLVDVEGDAEVRRDVRVVEETGLTDRVTWVVGLDVDVLICGAISRSLENMLVSAGVQVIPQTCGPVENILGAFISGQWTQESFLMPGNCGARRRFSRYRGRQERKEGNAMRIAVTSKGRDLQSKLDPRFARTRYFIVTDTEAGVICVVDNEETLKAVQGAGIQAAWNVHETGAEAVLTGNVGPNAFAMLDALSIKVYVGVTGTVQDAIRQFKAGELEAAEAPNVEPHWA